MADQLEIKIQGIGEQAMRKKPILVDFLTLKSNQRLSMRTVELTDSSGEIYHVLEVNKIETVIGTADDKRVDSITVSAGKIVDEACKWTLDQEYKNVPEKELKRLLGISQALNEMLNVLSY